MDQKLIEEIKEKLKNLSKTMEGMSRGEINSQLKEIAGCAKDELVVFEPQVDDKEAYEKSSPKIMIVGREPNGWDRKHKKSVKLIAEQQTGSGFWQTIKHILALKELNGDENKLQEMSDKDRNGMCSSIVWSNLYKLASCKPEDLTNNLPSWLYTAQFNICAKLLELEYEDYDPDKVIFLSNWKWAKPFVEKRQELENKNYNEIGATGEIDVGKKKVTFIASKYHASASGVSPKELAKNIIKSFE